METTYTPLPAELRPLLPTHDGEPLRLLDGQTQKVYLLVEKHDVDIHDDDYIRALLREAEEDIANGDVAPLDMGEIKAEARRIFEQRHAKS